MKDKGACRYRSSQMEITEVIYERKEYRSDAARTQIYMLLRDLREASTVHIGKAAH